MSRGVELFPRTLLVLEPGALPHLQEIALEHISYGLGDQPLPSSFRP